MKTHICVLLLAAMLAGCAAGTFNFFPNHVHVNCTVGDCSFPSAWSEQNQTAYTALGNTDGSALLTVAVQDYYPRAPVIYFSPGAWCDTSFINVTTDEIAAALPPTATRRSSHRRRLLFRALMADTASPPAQYNITTPCSLQQVTMKIGSNATQVLQPVAAQSGATNVFKADLGTGLPDGLTCMDITATYQTDAAHFATSPDYTNDTALVQLPATTDIVKTVCLYKFTKQADALLTFDMCSSNIFTVNVSEVSPLPVNITLSGAPVGANLLRPLVKVWGFKFAELDGTPSSNSYDQSVQGDATWITKYIPFSDSYAGEELSFPLSDQLEEGYYNTSATISLLTSYPRLTDLVGLNQIAQTDAAGTSAGVSGLYEAATWQIHDHAVIGVQKMTTPTTLSAISCTNSAGTTKITAGDELIFTWQFSGVGSATCTHDGVAVSNVMNNVNCVSPLSITAKDVSSTDTAHTVAVTFTDVCGRERTAQYQYTQTGVKAVTSTEILNSDGTITVINTTSTTHATGAASAIRPSAVAMSVFGGALALLALA